MCGLPMCFRMMQTPTTNTHCQCERIPLYYSTLYMVMLCMLSEKALTLFTYNNKARTHTPQKNVFFSLFRSFLWLYFCFSFIRLHFFSSIFHHFFFNSVSLVSFVGFCRLCRLLSLWYFYTVSLRLFRIIFHNLCFHNRKKMFFQCLY